MQKLVSIPQPRWNYQLESFQQHLSPRLSPFHEPESVQHVTDCGANHLGPTPLYTAELGYLTRQLPHFPREITGRLWRCLRPPVTVCADASRRSLQEPVPQQILQGAPFVAPPGRCRLATRGSRAAWWCLAAQRRTLLRFPQCRRRVVDLLARKSSWAAGRRRP